MKVPFKRFKWKKMCDDGLRNVPLILRDLNPWSPVGGAVWRGYEEVQSVGQ